MANTEEPPPGPSPSPGGLFRRYRRVVLATLAAVLALALLVLARELIAGVDAQVARVRLSLSASGRELDRTAKSARDHVELIAATAHTWLEIGAPLPDVVPTALADDPAGGFSRAAAATPPLSHLSGMRPTAELPPSGRQELAMALALDPLLATSSRNMRDAVWVYYVSAAHAFFNVHPWTRGRLRFSPELYDTVGYLSTTPAQDPARRLVFSPVYEDPWGAGLIVTCAKPVYARGAYRGQAGLDLALARLDALARSDAPQRGRVLLVNDHGQLLAHSDSGALREITTFDAGLPAELRTHAAALLSDDAPQSIGGYVILKHPLTEVPWRLVYVARRSELVVDALPPLAIAFLTLVGGLLLMTLASQLTIRREFIRPAQSLIGVIESGRGDSAEQEASAGWAPWFEIVSRAFADLEAARRTLEERVVERTRALDERNAELERALAELARTQERLLLEEKMASLGSLAASLAHEVNTPIGVIQSSADTGSKLVARLRALHAERSGGVVDERVERALLALERLGATTREAGHRIADLIHALGAFEHTAGTSTSPVDVNQELQRALESAQARIPAGVHVTLSLGATRRALASPGEVTRTVAVLLTNALEAVGQRGAIELATYDDGDRVVVRVRDDGPGIPADRQRELFDFRLHRDHARVRVGIGLKVAYAIASRHGGSIEVSSSRGAGATFWLRLRPAGDAPYSAPPFGRGGSGPAGA